MLHTPNLGAARLVANAKEVPVLVQCHCRFALLKSHTLIVSNTEPENGNHPTQNRQRILLSRL